MFCQVGVPPTNTNDLETELRVLQKNPLFSGKKSNDKNEAFSAFSPFPPFSRPILDYLKRRRLVPVRNFFG